MEGVVAVVLRGHHTPAVHEDVLFRGQRQLIGRARQLELRHLAEVKCARGTAEGNMGHIVLSVETDLGHISSSIPVQKE